MAALVKNKGITINLGGTDYVLPPISLGALEQLQERISEFNGNVMDAKQVTTVIDSTFASIVRNYPDITREQVSEMIDIGNMEEVFSAVMDVSGLKRKALEAGSPVGGSISEVGIDWTAIYTHLIASCPGWTWEYIADHMDLPRLYAMNEYWNSHPPIHLMVAAYLGIKPKAVSKESSEVNDPAEVEAFIAMFAPK